MALLPNAPPILLPSHSETAPLTGELARAIDKDREAVARADERMTADIEWQHQIFGRFLWICVKAACMANGILTQRDMNWCRGRLQSLHYNLGALEVIFAFFVDPSRSQGATLGSCIYTRVHYLSGSCPSTSATLHGDV